MADLILVQRQVRETVTRLVRELDPEVVGLSIMTFQRRTAARLIELVRVLRPGVKITRFTSAWLDPFKRAGLVGTGSSPIGFSVYLGDAQRLASHAF